MTVRDAVKVLKTAKEIKLGYGENAITFDKNDPLMIDAYGDYVVDEICGDSACFYEIGIAMRPVKERRGQIENP